MSDEHPVFDKELFQFLVELRFNNDRTWFEANKVRYQQVVKRPLEAGGVYQDGGRPKRIAWSELSAKTFSIDTMACERCGYSPVRVVAVVAAPTREQLEAIRHPGAEFGAVSWRSRAPPVGQLELPMGQRVS